MSGNPEIIAEKGISAHVEETLGKGAVEEARLAAQAEREATLWQSLKANKRAVFWSAVISMSIVMEGYVLSGNLPLNIRSTTPSLCQCSSTIQPSKLMTLDMTRF